MDYIMREIGKIGKMIEAILFKIGLIKEDDLTGFSVYGTARTELLERLNIDIDTVLEKDDPSSVLTVEYGFDNEELEKFAELLYELTIASDDNDFKARSIAGIGSIYKYLDKNGTSISFNRQYILQELRKIT